MADNMFDIKIGISLDQNGKQLTDQWMKIKKEIESDKINIKFDFGNAITENLKQITQMSGELNKLSSATQNLNNVGKSVKVIDSKDFLNQINEISRSFKTVEDVKKELSKFGEIRIISNETGRDITNFTAQVKTLNGMIAELRYNADKTIGDRGQRQLLPDSLYNLEGITRFVDGTEKAINKVDEIKAKYTNIIKSMGNENLLPQESIDKTINLINSLNESSSKLNLDNVKNQINELTKEFNKIQQQIKDTQEVFSFSNNMSGKIDNLYANSKGVDLNRLGELSNKNNNLVDYNNVGQLQEVKKLYEEILQQQKEYISQENQKQKQEEQLYTYVATQEERLKNIRGSYNTKLDTNNNGYQKLETEYNSIIKELENYRIKGQQLTSEESNNIKTRINDLNREKSSIIEITKTVEQQSQALESLRSKFGSLVDLSEINKIKTNIQSLNTSTNFKGDNSAITNEINQLREVATERQRLTNMGKIVGSNSDLNIGSSTKDIESFLRNTVSYKAQITSITQEMDKFGNSVKIANYNISNGNQVNRYKLSIDEMSGSVRNLSIGMNDLTSKHANFTESLSNALSGFIRFQVVAVGVMQTINSLKQGLQEISEINKANINVAMITGDSLENVEKGNKGLLDLAKNLKVANSEVMAGQESWLRSGVSQEEANKNLETTTKLSRIAGEENKAMADSLIVVKNAYDLNSKSLEGYASKVALLDNQSATSSAKINAAMQYSAETFKSMGVDMDTALSWITNFSEKSAMSGEAIGRGFRSMLTNFHKIQQGYKEGSEEEVGAVNKIEEMLSSKGIALRKNKDEWVDISTVMKNIQENIGKFSQVELSSLAFKIGGKEQAEMTLSTLNNMKRINELNNKLKEDDGATALNKSYEKYKQGIEAAKADLKNAMTGLWMNIIDEKKITGVLSGLTNFVNTLQLLTTTSKTTGVAVLGLATTITVLSVAIGRLGFASVNTQLLSFFSTITKGGTTLLTFFQLLPTAMAETKGVSALLSATFGGLATSIKAVTVAILSSPLTWVVAALGLVTYAVTKHIQKQTELKQQVDSLKTSYENLNQSMSENNSVGIKTNSADLEKTQKTLQDLIKQKKELESSISKPSNTGDIRVDSAINNANTSKLNELNKTIEEQEKVLSDAGVAFDSLTGEIYKLSEAESKASNLDMIDKIQQTTQAEINNKDAITSLGNEYLGLLSKQQRNSEQNERMGVLAEQLKGKVEGLIVTTDEHGNTIIKNTGLLSSEIEILGQEGISVEKLTQVKLNASKNDAIIQDGMTRITYENAKKRIQILQEEANAWNSAANSIQVDSVTEGVMHNAGQTTVKDTVKGFANNAQKSAVSLQQQVSAIDDIYSKATSGVSGLTNELKDGYTPSSDDATSSTKKNKEAQDALSDSIKNVKNQMQSYENTIKSLDNVLYSLENSMAGMSETSDDYINSLKQENELFKQRISLVNNATSANNSYIGSIGSMGGVGVSALGQQVIAEAQKYIGTPYVSGGESPQGFDCSGLVQYVFDQFQIQLDRTTYTQINDGQKIGKNEVQPGDLVFFGDADSPHHVGIYMGNDQFIESPHTGASVRISNLSSRSDYSAARRVISDNNYSSNLATTSSTTNTGITASQINTILKGVMSGHGEDYIKYGQQYGVDPALAAAITMHEVGTDGNSYAARVQNNPAGIMDWNNNWQTVKQFGSLEEGIQYAIKNLKQEYLDQGLTSISEIGSKYAPVGAANDPNGLNKYWIPKVTEYYKQITGKTGSIDTVDLANSANSQIQDILSKNQDYLKQNIDFARKIQENNTKIYEAYISRYDKQISQSNTELSLIQERYKYYEEGTSIQNNSSNTYKEQEWKEINAQYGILKAKEDFIKSQLNNSGNYDAKTLSEIKQNLQEVQLEEVKTVNTLHESFKSWLENTETWKTQGYQDNISQNQDKLSLIETKDSNANYGQRIKLNQQMLQDQNNITDKIKEQIEYTRQLYANEQNPVTKQLWLDEIDKFNKDLIESNIQAEKFKQTMNNLAIDFIMHNLEESLKPINDELKELNNQESLLADNGTSDKLQNKIDTLEEMSDALSENTKAYAQLYTQIASDNNITSDEQSKLDDLKNTILDSVQSINEAIQQLQELKLDNLLAPFEQRINELSNTMSLLKYQIDMVGTQDYGNKVDLTGQELTNNQKQIQQLIDEYETLSSQSFESGTKEAEALSNKLASVRDRLMEASRNGLELRKTFDQLVIDKMAQPVDLLQSQISQQQDNMSYASSLGNNLGLSLGTNFIDTTSQYKGESTEEKISNIVEDINDTIADLSPDIDTSINDNIDGLIDTLKSQTDTTNDKLSNINDAVQIIKENSSQTVESKNVFGTGSDLEQAKIIAKQYGISDLFNFVDTNTSEYLQNKDKYQITSNDIVLGGTGAIGGINSEDINGATRLGGKDRYETINLIKDVFGGIAGKLNSGISNDLDNSSSAELLNVLTENNASSETIVDNTANTVNAVTTQTTDFANNINNLNNNLIASDNNIIASNEKIYSESVITNVNLSEISSNIITLETDLTNILAELNTIDANDTTRVTQLLQKLTDVQTAINNIKINVTNAISGGTTSVPKNANGTVGNISIVGDGEGNNAGYELAILPNGKTIKVGENGWTLANLPQGTQIISHEDSEKILSQGGIQKYANGTDYNASDIKFLKEIDTNSEVQIAVNNKIAEIQKQYTEGLSNEISNADLIDKQIELAQQNILLANDTIKQFKEKEQYFQGDDESLNKLAEYESKQNKIIQDAQKQIQELTKSKVDSLFTNADKQIKQIEDDIKRLGNIDTDEEKLQQLKDINGEYEIYKNNLLTINDEITKQNDLLDKTTNNSRLSELLKKQVNGVLTDSENTELIKLENDLSPEAKTQLLTIVSELSALNDKKTEVEVNINSSVENVVSNISNTISSELDEVLKDFEDAISERTKALDDSLNKAQQANETYDNLTTLQDLEKEYNNALLNNSIEGKTRQAELKKQIQEQQRKITETNIQTTVNNTKKYLSDELDDKKKIVDNAKEDLGETMKLVEDGIISADESLSRFKNKWATDITSLGDNLQTNIIDKLDKMASIVKGLNLNVTSNTGDNVEVKGSFSRGGIVDFTGKADVHGSTSNPELMLNNSQASGLFNFIKNIPDNISELIGNINIPSLNLSQLNLPSISLPNISNLATANANNISNPIYNLNVNVENMNANSKSDVDNLTSTLISNIKKLGGKF